jgi:activator of 2-hydroxyglutaryl-CoA dehydratase
VLTRKLMRKVQPTEFGRYAGALGAALLAKEK